MKLGTVFGTLGLLGLALANCTTDPYAALARAHAPVHFQDTDDTNALADELSAVDYDGEYVTTNNWDHLGDPSTWTTGMNAVVYRSVVETCTHWFIVYAMYHPRDWSDGDDDEHENDLEGMLVAVTKDGTAYGRIDGVITVFHTDFYSYVPDGSPWTDGVEDIDGTLSYTWLADGPHPTTAQEAKGHGMKAWPYAGDFAGNPGEDGITYLPGDVSQAPASGNARDVTYTLVNLFDNLWFLQLAQSAPWATWGVFDGDGSGTCGESGWFVDCDDDAANAPWGWNDTDDREPTGTMALDPAGLVAGYFGNLGSFSFDYVSNRYLEDLRANGYSDAVRPSGFPADVSLDALYGHLGAVCPAVLEPWSK